MTAQSIDVPPLAGSELLGRRVFDGKKAKRAESKNQIVPKIFRERSGVDMLSVDRLDQAPIDVFIRLGDEDATGRGQTGIRGWATLTVARAQQDGRTVKATPRLENPYHADICLNIGAAEDRDDVQNQHALALALAASWLGRP